ncbi:MAG: UDP-N-acetylmuramate dehydrogenase [Pseudomonadota bacterium]|nr:UDP-N-acetylmuramate dehydrogenase [Pseudomonadota bacterium]
MNSKASNQIKLKLSSVNIKGKISFNRSLKKFTWLRVGGDAEIFFQPDCIQDLVHLIENIPTETNIFPIGVCSNLLVRDGGIPGVTIRLGRGFSQMQYENGLICVGAGALDSKVADFAAESGIDLSFLKTIPGTIGGAVKMNAGCYGHSMADIIKDATVLSRCGKLRNMSRKDLGLGYRRSKLPDDWIVVAVRLNGQKLSTDEIQKKMQLNQRKRSESQPVGEKTGGSTFKNPYDTSYDVTDIKVKKELRAWELISESNLRGVKLGGASVSQLHANFLINDGTATADDFEQLGSFIQRKVYEQKGVKLEWEIKRVGIKKKMLNKGTK